MKKFILLFCLAFTFLACSTPQQKHTAIIGYVKGDVAHPLFLIDSGRWTEYPLGANKNILSKPNTLPVVDKIAIDSTWNDKAVPRFIISSPEVKSAPITMKTISDMETFRNFYKEDERVKQLYDMESDDWKVRRYATIYSVGGQERFAVLSVVLEGDGPPSRQYIVLEKTNGEWHKLFTSIGIRPDDIIGVSFKLKYAADVNGDEKIDYIFSLGGYNFDGFMLYNTGLAPVISGWTYH